MKSSLIRTSCVIAFCLLSLKVVAGCAVITIETLTKFDSSEYIFIGEVIGMSDPITSEKFHGKAWGVKIRVKEYVNLPKTPAGHFVVLPFTLESDCKDGGRSAEELHRYFPVGSEVRVIAKESRYAKGLIGEGNIGLEVRPHNLGSIARNYSGTDKAASVGSIYDYSSYVPANPCGLSEKDVPDYEAHAQRPEFEYRKDLLRLRNAKSEKDRIKILERLLYLPSDEYLAVVTHYLKNREIIKRLTEEREVWWRKFAAKVVLSC